MSCFVRADSGVLVNLDLVDTVEIAEDRISVVATYRGRGEILIHECQDAPEAGQYLNEIAARANGGSAPSQIVRGPVPRSHFGTPQVRS